VGVKFNPFSGTFDFSGGGVDAFADLTDLAGSSITTFETTASGNITLTSATHSKIEGESGTENTYADATPTYFEAITSNSADGSSGQIFLGHGSTPEFGIYLGDGSVNLETSFKVISGIPVFTMDTSLAFLGNNYTSAGTTELNYGKPTHRFAGTAPSGSVIIDRTKSGNFFFIHNATASSITFTQKTTETFNGSSTFTALAGKWYLFTQFSSLGVYGVSELNSSSITALTGDVTASGSGSVAATIANDAVTYAKMQNVSATDKVLGRSSSGSGDVEEIACTAAGRALLDDASAAAQVTTLGLDNTKIATIGITIDGGGSAITTGSKGYVYIPYACTINSATLLADQSSSIVIDVKKSTYSGFPTTSSIAASAKPTLSSAQKSTDSTLTGWTTSVAAGDCIEFVVDSITTCTRVHLTLKVTKT
jgi:hypothetical protein